ncbi:MAG: ABC transporter ATP-binding protein, partial [Lachnospiraceae bacterium]|nr:ABC transporter ATP-binding protein [Lachnospiraceae bacterium]
FIIDVKAALTFAVVIPILSVIVFGIMKITSPMYKKVQGRLDRLLVAVRENLTGVRVLRAFRKEKDEIRNFEDANSSLVGIQKRSGLISALTNPLTYVVINLGTVALIYTGAIRVDSGDLTQGEVVALYNYIAQILIELVKLANLIVSITKALACADRISDILNEKGEGDPSAEYAGVQTVVKDGSVISFNDVSFTYKGAGAESLSHVSFDIERGETVGIIGGTGSGKSTLADLIAGFYKATEGTVLIEGQDINTYSEKQLLDIIGAVPQKAVLFRGTIRDNMRYAKEDATDDEIREALTTAQAMDFVNSRENVLDAEVEQGGRNFSGGQRQRLSIARTLVKKPPVLILDDSSSALDYATDAALRTALKKLGGGMTVIIISQRTAGIMNADRILVMDDGVLSGNGTHEELLQTCAVYRDIFYSQFPEKRKVQEVTL